MRQNEFQVHVNWEIFNTNLIPNISVSLFIGLINMNMSLVSSTLSIVLFFLPRFNRSQIRYFYISYKFFSKKSNLM